MSFIRVKDRATGHEYDIDARAFDESLHVKANKPRQYPDLTGDGDRPRPTKYATDLAGDPAETEE